MTKNYVEIEVKDEFDFEKKSFYQKISLGEEIDEEKADAIIEEGILKITILKKEEKKYKIKVR